MLVSVNVSAVNVTVAGIDGGLDSGFDLSDGGLFLGEREFECRWGFEVKFINRLLAYSRVDCLFKTFSVSHNHTLLITQVIVLSIV